MASTMWPLPSSGFDRSAGLSRPRAAASRSRKRTAARMAVSASSVSAWVARITGHTPPMSASAIRSAASAFVRRNSRIASASSLVASTAFSALVSSAARCWSGSALSSDSNRAGSATARSQRYGEPSDSPTSSASTFGAAASRRFSALPSALRPISVSHSATRAFAALRSVRRGASLIAEASVFSTFGAGLVFFAAGGPCPSHTRGGGD